MVSKSSTMGVMSPSDANDDKATNADAETTSALQGPENAGAVDVNGPVKESGCRIDVEDLYAGGIYGCNHTSSFSHHLARSSAGELGGDQVVVGENGHQAHLDQGMPQGPGVKRRECGQVGIDELNPSSENRSKFARHGTPQGTNFLTMWKRRTICGW